MSFRSFSDVSYHDYVERISHQISQEIESNEKKYILGVDEQDYKTHLTDKYSLTPVVIDFSSEKIKEPVASKEWREDQFRERYQIDVYTFTITFLYTGSALVLKLIPTHRILTSTEINVTQNTVSYSFNIYQLDPQEFQRIKNQEQNKAFGNLENANNDVRRFNSEIATIINNKFSHAKSKYEKENNFFAAINLKVNEASVFAAPTVTKKIIPQPEIAKGKEFNSEPAMAREIYNDILNVIYTSGKQMETKPSLYEGKDEEGLRDQFLYLLESRYDSTTASGEAFNRSGKTDIILKYAKDSTNLFVAECKIWHGPSEFLKAISQLFDLYLSWRDSKTALMLFVKNKGFSNVLISIKDEVKKHPYFVKENGTKGDSSFSYIFHLPQDKNKHVFFEIMAFHYDK